MEVNFLEYVPIRKIAIDFSSRNIAIAYKGKFYHYRKFKSKDLFERLFELNKVIKNFLRMSDVKICYLEKPALPPTPLSVKAVCQASGVVLSNCFNHNISVIEIHNKTWKKIVVGSGNAKKQDIMNYVINKYKFENISQDVADAICIYEFGEKVGWKTN